MRETLFATMALLGLAVLTGAWLDRSDAASAFALGGTRTLPAVGAAPASARGAADAPPLLSARDVAVEIEVAHFLRERHSGLADAEIDAVARTIVVEARRHDLEPLLVLGLIRVESAGYAFAVSHVGAYGLMQIMPATGAELAARMDVAWHGPDTLFDPIVNVRLGTAYLRELVDRYAGDVATALAAYNWGPGRIDHRLRTGADVPQLYITQVRAAHEQLLTRGS
ncbi:MAG: lytic transglycosylase domain-containing protein [Myxococcota bacterium]|nr:lytic transglycosylase domain-containing protein [Myxococcales bacterium]